MEKYRQSGEFPRNKMLFSCLRFSTTTRTKNASGHTYEVCPIIWGRWIWVKSFVNVTNCHGYAANNIAKEIMVCGRRPPSNNMLGVCVCQNCCHHILGLPSRRTSVVVVCFCACEWTRLRKRCRARFLWCGVSVRVRVWLKCLLIFIVFTPRGCAAAPWDAWTWTARK